MRTLSLTVVLLALTSSAVAAVGSEKNVRVCAGQLALAGRENRWGPALTTDPRSHDPNAFLYLVSAIQFPWQWQPMRNGDDVKSTFLEGNILGDPSHLLDAPFISASLVTPQR